MKRAFTPLLVASLVALGALAASVPVASAVSSPPLASATPPHVGHVQPSAGYSGLVVDVNGSGFAAGDKVFFGVRPARIAFVASSGSIVVYAPDGRVGSRVRVKVEGPSGSSNSDYTFTYLDGELDTVPGSGSVSRSDAALTFECPTMGECHDHAYLVVGDRVVAHRHIAISPHHVARIRLRYTAYGKELAASSAGRAAMRRDGRVAVVPIDA